MPLFNRRARSSLPAPARGQSRVTSTVDESMSDGHALEVLAEASAGTSAAEATPVLAALEAQQGGPGLLGGTHHAMKARGGKSRFFKGEWSKLLDDVKAVERAEASSDGSSRSRAKIRHQISEVQGRVHAYIESHQGGEGQQEERVAMASRLIPRLAQVSANLGETLTAGRNQQNVTTPGVAAARGTDDSLQGGKNAVDMLEFAGGREGIFKPDAVHQRHSAPEKYAHQSRENDRSVAASNVDRLLGTNVLVNTEYSSVGDEFGIVMDKAGGEALGGNTGMLDVDLDQPALREQLTDLQWLDALTGEADRHAGNLFIKDGPGGPRVQGIDNDDAFSGKQANDISFHPNPSPMQLGKTREELDTLEPTPQLISAKLHAQLMDDNTRDLYRDVLSRNLNEEELERAMARFDHWSEVARNLDPEQVIGGEGGRGWDGEFTKDETDRSYFGQFKHKQAQFREAGLMYRDPARHA